MDTFYATKLVSTTEGGMYGPGEKIAGDFDPDDDHNAGLIEAGLISRSTGAEASSEGDSGGSAADAGSGAQAAAGGADGGDASSATVGGEMEPTPSKPARRSRRAKDKAE